MSVLPLSLGISEVFICKIHRPKKFNCSAAVPNVFWFSFLRSENEANVRKKFLGFVPCSTRYLDGWITSGLFILNSDLTSNDRAHGGVSLTRTRSWTWFKKLGPTLLDTQSTEVPDIASRLKSTAVSLCVYVYVCACVCVFVSQPVCLCVGGCVCVREQGVTWISGVTKYAAQECVIKEIFSLPNFSFSWSQSRPITLFCLLIDLSCVCLADYKLRCLP